MVPFATIDTRHIHMTTIAPCEKTFIDSDWMEKLMNSGLENQLVLQPLYQEEDIEAVVEYNNWQDTWNKLKENHDESTSVSKKYADLIRCRARNTIKGDLIATCREGMHRTLAFASASLRSVISPDSGIFKPGTLNLAEFKKYLPTEANMNDDDLQSKMDCVLKCEKGFMHDLITIRTSWVVNREHSAQETMNAMSTLSRAIYDAKKLVANESVGATIGKFGATIIQSIAKEALSDLPDLSKCSDIPQHVRKTKKEVLKDVEVRRELGLDPKDTYASSPLLKNIHVINYIKDPTSQKSLRTFATN